MDTNETQMVLSSQAAAYESGVAAALCHRTPKRTYKALNLNTIQVNPTKSNLKYLRSATGDWQHF
jgi:hypothetical protein